MSFRTTFSKTVYCKTMVITNAVVWTTQQTFQLLLQQDTTEICIYYILHTTVLNLLFTTGRRKFELHVIWIRISCNSQPQHLTSCWWWGQCLLLLQCFYLEQERTTLPPLSRLHLIFVSVHRNLTVIQNGTNVFGWETRSPTAKRASKED
jgi:hypothetical protein